MSSSISSCQNEHEEEEEEKADDLYTAIGIESVLATPTWTAMEFTKTPRSKKRFGFPKRNEPTAPRPVRSMDDVEYFDNLIRDLAEISRLLAQNPSRFRYAHLSLMEEVFAVWNRIRISLVFSHPQAFHNNNNHRWSTMKRTTPPKSGSNSNDSPLNTWRQRSSYGSHSATPPNKWRGDDRLGPFSIGHFESSFHEFPFHLHKLEKKVFIPEVPNYNFIGRILGPRGISARQIEADTNCKILIRGKGSVKDSEKEKRLIDVPGYEHLTENLHVHISTEGLDLADCQRRLDRAVSIIEALLTPTYDEYKKTQLLQLAIINGTYRPLVKKKKPVY